MTLVLRVGGVQDTINAFRDLPRTIRGRHMKIALNAGGGVLRDAAVAFAPKETGLLKRSLKVKVIAPDLSHNPAHHGKPAKAFVGPSRDVVGFYRRSKSGRLVGIGAANRLFRETRREVESGGGNRTQSRRAARRFTIDTFQQAHFRSPARYAHLVERGTKRGVKAHRYLARAVQQKGEAAQLKIIQKLQEGISGWAVARAAKARGGNPFHHAANLPLIRV